MSETCVNPAEIQDDDLMAYVDGVADEATARHIRRCPACARRAEELATLQAALTAKLYRFSCPTPDQLIAYQRGELRGSERLAVAQHLRQCPHCARELAALAHEDMDREETGLGKRFRAAIKVLEAVLVTPQVSPRAPSRVTQATGVRGASGVIRPKSQVYRACETEIIVSQYPSRTHPRRWDLSGLVRVGGQFLETVTTSAPETDHSSPPARNQIFSEKPGFSHDRARAELYRDEGLIAVSAISPHGHFAFTAVEPADYDISLVWEDREIRLKGVQIE